MSTDILASSRRKRRKKILWKTGLIILAVLLFLGGIVGFFYISKFRIKDISIENGQTLDKEQLEEEISNCLEGKFFKILPRDNIFIFPKAEITAGLLQEFSVLKEVSISRGFPQKISVHLEERKPKSLWCVGSFSPAAGQNATSTDSSGVSCAFADENGFIYQPAPLFSGAIFPIFYDERSSPADIGKEISPLAEFQKLYSFVDVLNKNGINVDRTILKDNEEYEVYLEEGWYVKLNGKNEADISFNNLGLILEETIKEKRPTLEYVDLRSGNKIFFKYQ
jgi:hypothetical protein